MPTVVLVRKGGVVSSKPIIRSRIVENSRKVCTPRKILRSRGSLEDDKRGFRACELGVSTAPVDCFVHLFKGGA